MEVQKAILERRSVRSFTSAPIEKEKLEALAEAAIWAPCAGNNQTWSFVIVTKPETIRIIKTLSPGMLGEPRAIFAILSDKEKVVKKMGPAGETLALMDCSLAAGYAALRAHDMGLGSCLIRSFNPAAVREVLQAPKSKKVELLVILGYPAHEPKTPSRNTAVISWETWAEEV